MKTFVTYKQVTEVPPHTKRALLGAHVRIQGSCESQGSEIIVWVGILDVPFPGSVTLGKGLKLKKKKKKYVIW